MIATPEQTRTPEAVAEIFWLAFQALNEQEQQAVLARLRPARSSSLQLVAQSASTLLALRGLVAWGGDALEDSERLYDVETDDALTTASA
jgi:hypothetical protein